jgi:hypothetical protein
MPILSSAPIEELCYGQTPVCATFITYLPSSCSGVT